MPDDACDLTITEGNKALFPIIATVPSAPLPERTLDALADGAKVTLEIGGGRIVLAMPNPIEVPGDAVITFGDVATVRRTSKVPTGFVRIDGQPALKTGKRSGASITETVAAVTSAVAELRRDWIDSVEGTCLQDRSEQVESQLSDLEADVPAAVLPVMAVILFALGGDRHGPCDPGGLPRRREHEVLRAQRCLRRALDAGVDGTVLCHRREAGRRDDPHAGGGARDADAGRKRARRALPTPVPAE